MRLIAATLLAVFALLAAGCSEPVPHDKMNYAGEWRAPRMRLLITPDGRCEYSRRHEGGNSSKINAPIQRFEGDNFVVGVGPFSTTFVVSRPPHLDGGQWKMTVDGVELTRVSAADEVRT